MRAGGGSSDRPRAFWLVRSRAQAGVLTATAVTVLVVTFLASTMVGLAVRSPTVAVRQSIAAGPASSVAQSLRASLGSNAAEQDRAVRSIIAKRFAGATVDVDRTAFVPSVPVGAATDTEATAAGRSVLALSADHDLESRMSLVSGDWPDVAGSGTTDSPFSVAVDRELAEVLRVAPGKSFVVAGADGDVSLKVAGVWRAAHPSATAWLGVTAGAGGTDGRLVIAPAALEALSTTPAAQWVVAPDAERTTAGQLARLHAGFSGITDALTEDDAASPPRSPRPGMQCRRWPRCSSRSVR
ncbi:hypothetical protein [Leifsonia poae]|uniref:hypothetical protein n=1 Tax=Leifsonia poae TaxID=110933 RepID=UPI003D67083A